MKKETEELVKKKIAYCLKTLLDRNKRISESDKGNKEYPKSYNEIALAAELRKATVSDVFNMKTAPDVSTLILIIEAMGYSLLDFAHIYIKLNNNDLHDPK